MGVGDAGDDHAPGALDRDAFWISRAEGALQELAKLLSDSVVRKGTSDLDRAMITGESRPVRKTEGDAIIAATMRPGS